MKQRKPVKRWKKILKIALIAVQAAALLLFICYVNHGLSLARERAALQPLGETVEVRDGQMSVYIEGKGSKTLVFLSGGGTCSPILDFKSLYSELSGKHRIAVVERFGYGFSSDTARERDIESSLSETREALRKAGLTAPYVLCPHSMSGLEALYWAQKYPWEVEAIVGLDMAVPEIYEEYPVDLSAMKWVQFGVRSGLARLFSGFSNSDAIRYGTLTEEEKEIYRALFYSRTASGPMLMEAEKVKGNAEKVRKGGTPQVPMLLFVSNGEGTGWDKEKWAEYPKRFAEEAKVEKLVELDCPHYVHDHRYQQIAEETEEFLKGR